MTLAVIVLLAFGGLVLALLAPNFDDRPAAIGAISGTVFGTTLILGLLAAQESGVLYGAVTLGPLTAASIVLLSLVGLLVAAGATIRGGGFALGSGEVHALVMWGVLGGILLVGSAHLLIFYLALELSAYATYVLVGYDRERRFGTEAAAKYMMLGSVGSALLLFGMALVYAETGSLGYGGIAAGLAYQTSGLALGGLALMLVGLGFKLAWVPFHAWAPDAYQGSFPLMAGFLSTAPKTALALGLAVLLARAFGGEGSVVAGWIGGLALVSVVLGSLWALLQTDLKRLLAYSTIVHMGFLGLALSTASLTGFTAVGYYLVAYIVTSLGLFFVLEALEAGGLPSTLEAWKGLGRRNALVGVLVAVFVLSLAGVPLLAGFLAKLYVFAALAQAGAWAALVVAVVMVVFGYYFYFRVLAAVFLDAPAEEAPALDFSPTALSLVVLLALAVVVLGVWPQPVLDWLKTAIAGLV
ncbi:NADH-quinone oxidoreductase subunit N [Oceanithermus sp.]|uniref:NADH-quinone oxidoreductase subunit N n=1 Tax=Oceanithermus sp. TaxID=2268145 RepID=UPI00257C0CD9|nr:NADH-quinone oxidoreductase subunit N [Oceanithermus sp.]